MPEDFAELSTRTTCYRDEIADRVTYDFVVGRKKVTLAGRQRLKTMGDAGRPW